MFQGYLIMYMSLLLSLLSNLGLFLGGTTGNIMIGVSTIFTFFIFIYVFGGAWEKRLWDS